MPLRLVLAALSALLTPPGVQGELGVEVDVLLEEDHPRAQQPALVAGPGPELPPALRTAAPSVGGGSPPQPAAASGPIFGPSAAGEARPLVASSWHLARCGHDASSLDLPPPPRA